MTYVDWMNGQIDDVEGFNIDPDINYWKSKHTCAANLNQGYNQRYNVK